jgi:prepilin-type N-terminal cleavage/methylation domain-containing protein
VRTRVASCWLVVAGGRGRLRASCLRPATSNQQPATACPGFTFIEVLCALLVMAIVIPAIVRGVTLSLTAANLARHRTEASGLAQTELSNILASESWQNGNGSGDFAPDSPGYTWKSAVAAWPGDTSGAGLDEIDVTVTWTDRGRPQSVTLSSLAYPRNQGSTATTSSGTATQ